MEIIFLMMEGRKNTFLSASRSQFVVRGPVIVERSDSVDRALDWKWKGLTGISCTIDKDIWDFTLG